MSGPFPNYGSPDMMVLEGAPALSPFRVAAAPLAAAKFRDPSTTARGEPRAVVPMTALTTLWFNTGTLCNLACATCYIESSPRNDRLVYLSPDEVRAFLDEAARDGLPLHTVGFTGGEPFMNPGLIPMLDDALSRGLEALVLTNAMRPMMKRADGHSAIPVIWGTDAVHGANNIVGGTLFPHNIGLGAMRDPALVRRIGQATAAETAATGIDWSFAPTLAVVRDTPSRRASSRVGGRRSPGRRRPSRIADRSWR